MADFRRNVFSLSRLAFAGMHVLSCCPHMHGTPAGTLPVLYLYQVYQMYWCIRAGFVTPPRNKLQACEDIANMP